MEDMIEFAKYHGAGNDFIIIDDMKGTLSLEPGQIREMCKRHYGIGADGVIVARPSSKADVYMLFFNPDGSVAEMCGNGIRCFAKFLFDRDVINKNRIEVETKAGIKTVELIFDGPTVIGGEVTMGVASFTASDIPTTLTDSQQEVIDVPLKLNKGEVIVTCVSVGNPHCVVFVDSVKDAPVTGLGPVIENHKAFPEKTNVEFVQKMEKDHLQVRVWERGAGETLACGTGAVAAAAAACKMGYCAQPVRVDLPGGHLLVEFDSDLVAHLSGSAEHIFNGFLSYEFEERIFEKKKEE